MNKLEAAIGKYNAALIEVGAVSPLLLSSGLSQSTIDSLNQLDRVVITDELKDYLSIVSDYDFDKRFKLNSSDAHYLWGMTIIPADKIIKNYETRWCVIDQDEDFWPEGFLPILQFNNSDFVMVNCRPDSPTRGAVYEYIDCEGTLFIASSIESFIEGCTSIVKSGVVTFEDKDIYEIKDFEKYWGVVAATFQFRNKEPHELVHPREQRNW